MIERYTVGDATEDEIVNQAIVFRDEMLAMYGDENCLLMAMAFTFSLVECVIRHEIGSGNSSKDYLMSLIDVIEKAYLHNTTIGEKS